MRYKVDGKNIKNPNFTPFSSPSKKKKMMKIKSVPKNNEKNFKEIISFHVRA